MWLSNKSIFLLFNFLHYNVFPLHFLHSTFFVVPRLTTSTQPNDFKLKRPLEKDIKYSARFFPNLSVKTPV
ncbi:hypothetical protein CW304_31035 [Bacillus sp. UFRGS-B20]|nr:hypothetical protein CW304_31035 [Bacillus sp. UFRGS-B20]